MFSLGVADGVYMWATLGIDAGEFSRSLMRTAKLAVESGTADVLNGALNLDLTRNVEERAYHGGVADAEQGFGGVL